MSPVRAVLPPVTRRFVMGSVAAGPALALHAQTGPSGKPRGQADGIDAELVVNGRRENLHLDARTTLLDALRENLGLTGAKKGCDHGQRGACTVHVGDRRVLACLTLAVSVREPVTTIEGLSVKGRAGKGRASEGLAAGSALHPMQMAFIDQDAFQCGYCTPGQIMSAVACVREGHAGDAAEIREYMSGNLCRCAAYPHIVAAILAARSRMEHS
jgi:xanthine dehydrogenase YagT iron-sulfur-binding subunit